MVDRIKRKVAIVTGAGSVGPGWGNGKAVAVLYAREGAKVFAVDCNLSAVEETKSIIDRDGGECNIHQVDVSDSAQVRRMVEKCIEIYEESISSIIMPVLWKSVDRSKLVKTIGII